MKSRDALQCLVQEKISTKHRRSQKNNYAFKLSTVD